MKGLRELRRVLFPTKVGNPNGLARYNTSVVPSSSQSSPFSQSPSKLESIWQSVEPLKEDRATDEIEEEEDNTNGEEDPHQASDPVLLRTASAPSVKQSPPISPSVAVPNRMRADSTGSPHLRSISSFEGQVVAAALSGSISKNPDFADLTSMPPSIASAIKSQRRKTSNGSLANLADHQPELEVDIEDSETDLNNNSPTKTRARNNTLRRKLRRLSRKSIELSEKLDMLFINNGQENDTSKLHPFHKAAEDGDVQRLKQLITIINTDVNYKDPKDGSTALHKAAAANQVSAMEFLISSGADIHVTDFLKSTPLHWASNKGCDDAAVLLISKGAAINIRDKYGYSPLHLALKQSHTKVAQSLLLFGGSIDFKRYDGKTPMHLACERGNLEMVKFLVERGAKANLKDEFGETCVFAAANNGHFHVIRFLLFHDDGVVNVKMLRDPSGQNLIHRAARTGCKEIIDIMRELYASSESSSSDEDCPAFIELINEPDKLLWWTPLHVAAQHNNTGIIEHLISLGADVNAVDRSGDTPLHVAAKKGENETCQILCNSGAILTLKNKDKRSPRSILKKKGMAVPHKGQ